MFGNTNICFGTRALGVQVLTSGYVRSYVVIPVEQNLKPDLTASKGSSFNLSSIRPLASEFGKCPRQPGKDDQCKPDHPESPCKGGPLFLTPSFSFYLHKCRFIAVGLFHLCWAYITKCILSCSKTGSMFYIVSIPPWRMTPYTVSVIKTAMNDLGK